MGQAGLSGGKRPEGPQRRIRRRSEGPAVPLPVVLVEAGKVAHTAHLRELSDLHHALRPAAVADPDPGRLAAVRARAPGPRATPAQREAYARGPGGSLIHQVDLVHAVLAGSGRRLEGRLPHSDGWAGGAGVGCRRRPDDGLVGDLTHQRVPGHRRCREVLELTAEDGVATLSLPSPYARDESATSRIETWDATTALVSARTVTAEPGHTGFPRQPAAWARSLVGDGDGAEPLPGLADVREDARVVREAALRLA